MKTRFFLTAILAGLCALRAGAAYELDFRITQEPVADPDTRTLSWLAEENGALYTLEASLELLPPWFAVGHAPAAEDADLLEDELVELEITTDADRMFFRVVRDNGIRIEATCVEGEGVRLDVDITRWVSRTPDLSYFSQMVIERSASPGGTFDPVAVLSPPTVEVFDRTVDPDTAYYYRVRFSWWDNVFFDEFDSPPSNVASVFTGCAPPAGPVLTASCRPDRIALGWSRPEWMKDDSLSLQQWFLERSTDPDAPFDPEVSFDPVALGTEYDGEPGGFFVDTVNVLPETTYHYRISFTYTGPLGWQTTVSSPPSAVASASTCDTPTLGSIDVAFVWDNTGSAVKAALDKLKADPNLIDMFLDGIDHSSGGDYRLALVSTDADIVNVRLPFTDDRAVFKSALQNLPSISGGDNFPESTDECLNTVVNGLWESDRDPNAIPAEVQIGDFDPPFERSPAGGTWFLGDLGGQTNPMAFDISPAQLEAELNLLWSVNTVTGEDGREYLIEFSTAPNELFGNGSGLTPESEVVVNQIDPTIYLVQLKQKIRKVVVLLTDDRPGGFEDPDDDEWTYEQHGLRALGYAYDAAAKGIRINAIMVGSQEDAVDIMLDYAEITLGWYSQLNAGGNGVEDAILSFVYEDWIEEP